jgi:hypothetical protein
MDIRDVSRFVLEMGEDRGGYLFGFLASRKMTGPFDDDAFVAGREVVVESLGFGGKVA